MHFGQTGGSLHTILTQSIRESVADLQQLACLLACTISSSQIDNLPLAGIRTANKGEFT